ncbi:hypothetical protein HG15A2_48690 [Adhaeretor mobilis]|uniref:Uncharacterized protein n=1 Tax=Adhaeretor mobilis TaxID=1930276 RepID=A0A517N313_9BACT|nr:hypothetical protein HG15A2_48690 [Adhaeretor mobilis]
MPNRGFYGVSELSSTVGVGDFHEFFHHHAPEASAPGYSHHLPWIANPDAYAADSLTRAPTSVTHRFLGRDDRIGDIHQFPPLFAGKLLQAAEGVSLVELALTHENALGPLNDFTVGQSLP